MSLHVRAVQATDLAAGPAEIYPALADTAERRRLSGPAMRTFLAIADRWRLSEEQRLRLLGLPGRSTFYAERARRGERLTLGLDVLLRISAVPGIHQDLRIVFAGEQDALAWLSAPNQGPLFGGQRPIDLITSGTQDGLLAVRRLSGRIAGRAVPSAERGRSGLRRCATRTSSSHDQANADRGADLPPGLDPASADPDLQTAREASNGSRSTNAIRLTSPQPLSGNVSQSDGPWDHGIPPRRPAGRGRGFPRSHGPPENIVAKG